MTTTGKNRIMIFGPKTDGTYVVEFRTAEGESLAISIPKTETAVIRHFLPDSWSTFFMTASALRKQAASSGGIACA